MRCENTLTNVAFKLNPSILRERLVILTAPKAAINERKIVKKSKCSFENRDNLYMLSRKLNSSVKHIINR